MFNRNKPAKGQPGSGYDAARTFDQILNELDETGKPSAESVTRTDEAVPAEAVPATVAAVPDGDAAPQDAAADARTAADDRDDVPADEPAAEHAAEHAAEQAPAADQPAGDQPAAEDAPGDEAAATDDDVSRRADESAAARELSVADHAETLRATRDAQQQAQELLALASTARNEATEQAEQIVIEASEAATRAREAAERDADRLRKEAADWVAAERARADSASAELTSAAEKDAEGIRAEALRSAMAEAEETARIYVGEATARGARDADEIRGQATGLLQRAREVGGEARTSILDLRTTLETALLVLEDKLNALDDLAGEISRQDEPGVDDDPQDTDRTGSSTRDTPLAPAKQD